MQKLILMSLLLVTFALPMRGARHHSPVRGLRHAVGGVALYVLIYVALISLAY